MTRKYGTERTVSVTATPSELAAASPERIAILVSTTAVDVFISTKPRMGASQGIHVPNGQIPVSICQCHQGALLTNAWYARTNIGTATVTVIEGFECAYAEG